MHRDQKLFGNMSAFDAENGIVILDLTDGIEIQILRVIADTLNLKPIFRYIIFVYLIKKIYSLVSFY